MLPEFLHFLDSKNLISVGNIPNDDDIGFSHRLRVQKFVYLAKYFGLDLGYVYSIYRYGPYSSNLATDYYETAKNFKEVETSELFTKFNSDGFLNLVNDKDDGWLEIATTLLDQRPRFVEDGKLVDHVESIKCNYTISYIQSVLNNLKEHNLIS